jgi:hypothetical protein
MYPYSYGSILDIVIVNHSEFVLLLYVIPLLIIEFGYAVIFDERVSIEIFLLVEILKCIYAQLALP